MTQPTGAQIATFASGAAFGVTLPIAVAHPTIVSGIGVGVAAGALLASCYFQSREHRQRKESAPRELVSTSPRRILVSVDPDTFVRVEHDEIADVGVRAHYAFVSDGPKDICNAAFRLARSVIASPGQLQIAALNAEHGMSCLGTTTTAGAGVLEKESRELNLAQVNPIAVENARFSTPHGFIMTLTADPSAERISLETPRKLLSDVMQRGHKARVSDLAMSISNLREGFGSSILVNLSFLSKRLADTARGYISAQSRELAIGGWIPRTANLAAC